MPISRYGFTRWLDDARRGECVCYYVGLLMRDRQDGLDAAAVHTMATVAWLAYERKLVTLKQRKRDDKLYEYLAERV